MSKLDEALKIIEEGPISIEDLARRLRVSREEAEGIIEILKSLGYIREFEGKASSCENCPLKNICGGKCVRAGIKIFIPTFQIR
ncbi:hypothetical protein PNA2_1743 [Pyrococcus sp. NA2]|uniref:FeoC-like transcriptional regulator n=1 Tax=Pyrococcus sp. (strain NA2) TaxID=342949 RepID=UPI000209AB28|nr:FeoC-like transcriptional regulator [Pyrococcus sp. NA2]AEC52657.1 hypothetical protein PNA2_1743 [Pyrococcus sp. NA2]